MEIIGHRGASGSFPENTMPAFRRAWELGADGIECDVQFTRDGRYVVFHDEDGERLAGQYAKIARTDWTVCSQWDVGQWKDEAFHGTRMPLLPELLTAAPPSKHLFLEIKFHDRAAVRGLADQLRNFPDLNISLLTFDEVIARACRAEIPERPVLLNVEEFSEPVLERAVLHRYSGLSMKWASSLRERDVRLIKEAGLKTAVWTVNEPEDVIRSKHMGIDWLMTDWPERAIERLRNE